MHVVRCVCFVTSCLLVVDACLLLFIICDCIIDCCLWCVVRSVLIMGWSFCIVFVGRGLLFVVGCL